MQQDIRGMMEGVGVEVLGVPKHLSTEQTIDKLTIHFLRKRNGGNQVQRVIYPTPHPGQAIVIFEEPYVASRVLKQTHVVDFGPRYSAPVEVRAADRPEVDMPVETYLDLSTFPNSSEVQRLLKSHGFQITELGRDRWHLTGSFMKLTAVKARLTQLLEQDMQAQKKSSSASPTINGHGYPYGATSKHYTSGTSAHVGSRSSALLSDHYAQPPSPTHISSRGSGSQQSKASPPDHIAAQSPRDPRSRGESPFMITADVLHYAQCIRKKDIEMILQTNESEMDVKAVEGDLSLVTVVGRGSRVAKQKLQLLLNELTFTLRTQDIELATLDRLRWGKVKELIQAHQEEYPLVLITQQGNTIHLTGPSADSYDFQQILIGRPVSPMQTSARGRLMDRGSGSRRSSSLPRVRTKDRTEGALRPVAAAQSYAHKNYQENLQPTRAVQVAAVEATKVYTARRRSLSESQGEEREQRGARKPKTFSTVHSPEAPSPREKKPSALSKFQAPFQNFSASEFKRKMSRNSKKPESSS